MICAVKSLKVKFDLKLKAKSEFSNVWGEYKNHSNPYIQGTTVPVIIIGSQYTVKQGKNWILSYSNVAL